MNEATFKALSHQDLLILEQVQKEAAVACSLYLDLPSRLEAFKQTKTTFEQLPVGPVRGAIEPIVNTLERILHLEGARRRAVPVSNH